MRLAYFDCFSGISGAMALGAAVHAGADLGEISEALSSLPTAGFELEREDVEVLGISAARVHVRSLTEGVIWTYSSIRSMLDQAELPPQARRISLRAFRLLAEADARVHGREADLVTFHDAGEPDVLVSMVGTALALQQLHVDRIFASPIPTGLGMARTEHGMSPIPSPVVMELLKGAPTYSRGIPVELVTPVGAAILAAVAEGYGDMPMMRAELVGYGAGHTRLDFPNVVRLVVGEEERGGARSGPEDEGVLLEARLGEAGPQAVPALLDELTEAGAIDAWLTPVVGRDGEPAVMASAVAPPRAIPAVRRILEGRAIGGLVRALPLLPETLGP